MDHLTPAELVIGRAFWRRWYVGCDREKLALDVARSCGVSYNRVRWTLMGWTGNPIQLPDRG